MSYYPTKALTQKEPHIREQTLIVPQRSDPTDVPTPVTTMSAAMGHDSSLEQESKTRQAAKQAREENQAKHGSKRGRRTRRRRGKVDLRTITNPQNYLAKESSQSVKVDNNEASSSTGSHRRFPHFLRALSPAKSTLKPLPPLPVDDQDKVEIYHDLASSDKIQQTKDIPTVQDSEYLQADLVSPISSTASTTLYPPLSVNQRPQAMILGGSRNLTRLSTYMTPSIDGNYAETGPVRLVTRPAVVSHQAEIVNSESDDRGSVEATIIEDEATEEGLETTARETEGSIRRPLHIIIDDLIDASNFLPRGTSAHRRSISMPHLPGDSPSLTDAADKLESESTPVTPQLSAMPKPLNVAAAMTQYAKVEGRDDEEEAEVYGLPDALHAGTEAINGIREEFDGFREEIDAFKMEVTARIDTLEGKMDRVLELMEQSSRDRQRTRTHGRGRGPGRTAQQTNSGQVNMQPALGPIPGRELRGNLVAMPPHVPFHGYGPPYNRGGTFGVQGGTMPGW